MRSGRRAASSRHTAGRSPLVGAVFAVFRPLAIALGLFVVLNAGASAARPALGAGRLLVNVPLPEPYLSFSLVPVALCCLFPAHRSPLRIVQQAILVLVGLAVAANIVRFYALIGNGLITTSLPVPFSALVLAVIVTQGLSLLLIAPPVKIPIVVQAVCVVSAFFLLIAAHIVTFGNTDYRQIHPADAAVILGARVNADWSVSPTLRYRLLTGIELVREGRVQYLVMTGGTGASGVNEAEAMARFAEDRDVSPEAILIDREGITTYASALNCGTLCRRYELQRVMVVSQYYHLARSKLIFERQGLTVLTVPARVGGKVKQNLYYLLRESLALPYYYLCCTLGNE